MRPKLTFGRSRNTGLPPFAGFGGLQLATAGIALASGLLLLAPTAQATPLPPATSSVYINTGSSSMTGSTYAQLGGGTGSVALYPSVDLQARINQDYTQIVDVTLDYYFEVIGGSAGASVPVLIATNLLSSGTYPQYGSASLGVFTGGGVGITGANVCTYSADCPTTQFNGNLSFIAVAGSEYRIHMTATAEGHDVSASADPYIFVDPTFADAAAYSIQVSDGIGNGAAAVPTPGTLPLLGSGLGLFRLVSRRGRRAPPPLGRSGQHGAQPLAQPMPARILQAVRDITRRWRIIGRIPSVGRVSRA